VRLGRVGCEVLSQKLALKRRRKQDGGAVSYKRAKKAVIMNWQNYFLLIIPCLLLSPLVHAEGTASKERAAKKACLSGDYQKGVAILSDLYVNTDDPTHVFNQGRCFEQNRRYDDAIGRFEEYLRVAKKASKSDREDAEKHIAACRASLAQTNAPAVADAASISEEKLTAASVRRASKEVRERAAKRACLTGNPDEGVAILTDLYLDLNDLTFLFNQGRCFEQNRRYEDAIGRFREYLVKAKNLSQEDKDDTERHIATCESYLRSKEATKPVAGEPPSTTSAPAVVPQVHAGVPEANRAGSGLRTAGWVVAAAGVAGLATGLAFNLKYRSSTSDLQSGYYDPDVDATRKSYRTAAWIGYGAGAACLASGAILYYIGWRHGGRPSSLALLPALGTGAAGTVLMGAF
jgi:tetratricopeptide (TPR) repeat protein